MFVPLRKAKEFFGVSAPTLRKWADTGKIESVRTPSGQRLFKLSSFNKGARRYICYCRVSSASQKDDLRSQVRFVQEAFPNYEIIKDIGSGLNWKRKGFNALLDAILRGEVARVVVAHKDRLCRFGFEMFRRVASYHGTEIVVLDDTQLSPAQELTADLISIIHVFSCRLYGLRKYATKVSKDKSLPHGKRKKKGS